MDRCERTDKSWTSPSRPDANLGRTDARIVCPVPVDIFAWVVSVRRASRAAVFVSYNPDLILNKLPNTESVTLSSTRVLLEYDHGQIGVSVISTDTAVMSYSLEIIFLVL